MNDIHRGEIFYISRGGASPRGSEQYSDRPAVVVSNEQNNEHSGIVEVVYMTTQPKTDLPTHVTIRSTGRPSTVLCEQVNSISVERIGSYIGEVSEQEMTNIDIALMISLQLDGNTKTTKKYTEKIKEQQDIIDRLTRENEAMTAIKAKAEETVTEGENVAKNGNNEAEGDALIRAWSERDIFRSMYEKLLDKLIERGAVS